MLVLTIESSGSFESISLDSLAISYCFVLLICIFTSSGLTSARGPFVEELGLSDVFFGVKIFSAAAGLSPPRLPLIVVFGCIILLAILFTAYRLRNLSFYKTIL